MSGKLCRYLCNLKPYEITQLTKFVSDKIEKTYSFSVCALYKEAVIIIVQSLRREKENI